MQFSSETRGLGSSIVTMMQSAESLVRSHSARPCRTSPAVRCLLPQSEVCAVFVVVANIVREQSFQMALVHRNDVVQQIMAAAFDPTLCHAVLPRTFEGGPDCDVLDHVIIPCRVVTSLDA